MTKTTFIKYKLFHINNLGEEKGGRGRLIFTKKENKTKIKQKENTKETKSKTRF